MKTLILLLFLAGDWLNPGGDAQHSGWQRYGRTISVETVAGVRLLWEKELPGAQRVGPPAILGPIITHRGVKELIFAAADADRLYAVDADLGRVFWSRRFESTAGACGSAALALTPPPPGQKKRGDEDSDEGTSPMRPIFFATGGGELHTLRPADGADMTAIRQIAPARELTQWQGEVFAMGCDGVGVTVDEAGKAHRGTPAPLAFAGGLIAAGDIPKGPEETVRSLAGGVERGGERWIFAGVGEQIRAYRAGAGGITAAWQARGTGAAVVNGVLFAIDDGRLVALNAKTGANLWRAAARAGAATALAIANGHISFAVGNRLYCYGLPLEI